MSLRNIFKGRRPEPPPKTWTLHDVRLDHSIWPREKPSQQAWGYAKGYWDFVVRSYEAGQFCVETVHKGEQSLNMELTAIRHCEREADVWAVRRLSAGGYDLPYLGRIP